MEDGGLAVSLVEKMVKEMKMELRENVRGERK